ncbi:uncharacterized protein [Physcomitrium patens]|uniref:uncharacterized protein n=1 Tax=Physcomitrium patens TaxID=3218 RepID=UPI003CCD65B3
MVSFSDCPFVWNEEPGVGMAAGDGIEIPGELGRGCGLNVGAHVSLWVPHKIWAQLLAPGASELLVQGVLNEFSRNLVSLSAEVPGISFYRQ